MKITLLDKYKSLHPFESDELDSLTVITGKNGSGKSQLLNLIFTKFKNAPEVSSIRISLSPEVERIQFEGIIKDNLKNISYDEWKSVVKKLLDDFKNLNGNNIKLLEYILDKNLQSKIKYSILSKILSDEPEYLELLKINVSEVLNRNIETITRITKTDENNVLRKIYNNRTEKLFHFIKHLSEKSGKAIEALTELDFFNLPIDESLIDKNELFSSQIEYIFYNYAKRRDINRKNWFFKKEDGEENDSISDEDFIQSFPQPWEIINSILEANGLDFYFKGIEKKEFSTDITIDFTLLKKSTSEEIPFNDLSSGEKVIIGLILKLFTSEYYGRNLNFPDLILLDEPDAHLHPEMSNLLINVLEKTFVTNFGIKVIFTTHSPSTIALLNENNIYQISNGQDTSLKKISKDEALKMLTSFIPTLNIDYKNHKQVFVESPTDRFYYQIIFDKRSQYEKYPFKLYFISNGYGKGSSSQVIETVDAIRKSENKSFFGIIDWDKVNEDSDYIKVHGENIRYSIENYVYDPIYLVMQLMELKAHNVHGELGLDETYNQYQLGNEKDLAEKAVDWFFEKFYNKFQISEELKQNRRTVKFLNGMDFLIPIWYLEFQGHDLESKLKTVFPALEKYRNEGELQKNLSIISAKCYPFVHFDTIEVFEKIIDIG
ncbi:ATP-binding protein [Flavobacterium terrae]|uniref:AAA ATPase domain-containing protein n=1 Tax=Flavobacterium terrae TaxID=415425 RepID=A0A1M6GBK3_9FLAO|nr:ATP-binding protein [Flavobacterium terrae]SHJ07336.1 AAA ATPase domain-containing protein [Flavobacterium terrae]